jgi:hypothetical protein
MRFLTSNIEHRTPNDEIASLHFSKDDIFRFRTDANLQMDGRPIIRKMHVVRNTIILAGICWLFGFSWIGCGVKGPPVPPRQPPLPAVSGLAYRVADRAVILTWSLPGPLSGRQAEKAAFGIYRSRTVLEDPACEGCPLVFEKAEQVPYLQADDNRYSSDVPLDPGYRYVFKVRLETGGIMGPDSNSVQFDYLPNAPSGGSQRP